MIFAIFLAKKKLAFSLILYGFASLFTTALFILLATAARSLFEHIITIFGTYSIMAFSLIL
jgi:hypothetical protein